MSLLCITRGERLPALAAYELVKYGALKASWFARCPSYVLLFLWHLILFSINIPNNFFKTMTLNLHRDNFGDSCDCWSNTSIFLDFLYLSNKHWQENPWVIAVKKLHRLFPLPLNLFIINGCLFIMNVAHLWKGFWGGGCQQWQNPQDQWK